MKRKLPSLFGPRLTGKSLFWHRSVADRSPPSDTDAAAITPASTPASSDTFLERVWNWIHRTFPERQIYIRSDGRVQFFTFGPTLQVTLAGLSLIFLAWIAFATVNVIFKDRIIAAEDHRFQEMQSAYENRLTDLQISYDELNGALVGAEDKFKSTADELQTKQNAITGFLTRKNRIEAALAPGRTTTSATATTADTGIASESLSFGAPSGANISGAAEMPIDPDAAGSLTVMPGPAAPQPRTAKPTKASFLDNAWQRVERMAGALFDRSSSSNSQLSAAYAQHPALRAIADETTRVTQLGRNETQLMSQTENALEGDIGNMRDVIRRTGINPAALDSHAAGDEAMGGPEIPLEQVRIEGVSDPAFSGAYLRATAVLGQLDGLSDELSHIPMIEPVTGAAFDRSSGFGPRIDPFTGRYAFHPGIDFAGPWGAPVVATAAGTVVFAGNRGSYGNMVELDNGMGIHTRYGHLSAVTVKLGMHVEKGASVGRVGSTGRSTGPHVHYEIWFDNTVRNPSNFIEAGHHVL